MWYKKNNPMSLRNLILAFFLLLTVTGVTVAQDFGQQIYEDLSAEVGVVWAVLIGFAVVSITLYLRERNHNSKSTLTEKETGLVSAKADSFVTTSALDMLRDNIKRSEEAQEKTNQRYEEEIVELKKELAELKIAANERDTIHQRELEAKNEIIRTRDERVKALNEQVAELLISVNELKDVEMKLVSVQSRYDELKQEYDKQKLDWNTTFRQLINERQSLKHTGQSLDDTLAIPDTAELNDFAKEDSEQVTSVLSEDDNNVNEIDNDESTGETA